MNDQRHIIKEKTEAEKLVINAEKLLGYVPVWNQDAVKDVISDIKVNLEKIKADGVQ